MKSILRNTVLYALALFFLMQIFPGVRIYGGFWTFIIGGFALSLLYLIVKPILTIISLPLNIVTLGLFSSLTNIIILYLLTLFIPNVKIGAFVFPGANIAGFIIPRIALGSLLAFVVVSVALSIIVNFIEWLCR
ncbi:MAG TPA: phage holin family protein [Candidatus Saccharimonadales bacterium]|nr:phage holin family protein [Candidatus Saccharimonadales bacterium]